MVLDRIDAVVRPHRFANLACAQALEGLRLNAHRLGSEVRQDVRRTSKQKVTGENRDRVVPTRVRRRGTTPELRFVHDVIVIERGQVSELHDHRRLDDVVIGRAGTEVRREKRQERTEPLAASIHQMPGRFRNEGVVTDHRAPEVALNVLHRGR